jgi:hypothetical protein
MEYKYPQINRSQGYAWNALQRISEVVGLRPTVIGDTSGFTYVTFSRELTDPEKALLDGVMADNPTLPPSLPGSKFIIKDIFNQRNTIGTAIGFPYRVYYSESVLGSGNIDQVELHFDKVLTTQERNKVLSEFAKLITLK